MHWPGIYKPEVTSRSHDRQSKQALQDVAGSLIALRDKKRAGASRPK